MEECIHAAFYVHRGVPDIALYLTGRYFELVVWKEVFYKLETLD